MRYTGLYQFLKLFILRNDVGRPENFRLEKFRPEEDLNSDPCDTATVLNQANYQALWELCSC